MADPRLIDIALRIADGDPVDWDAGSPVLPDEERGILQRLRQLEAVARAHKAAAEDTPCTHWGSFALLERLGHGSYGDVYRARDPRLGRDVALKLLRDPGGDSVDTNALVNEGHLLARVRHPNVVTVYGADRVDGYVGLWMELIEGETLDAELCRRGLLPADEVAHIGEQLASALAAIHAAGLLHRDIKAQNVMRDRTGRIVLMDLGAGIDPSSQKQDLAGTPLYLAPEVLSGSPATARSDIYSLGVLLWHLTTGGFPVTGGSLQALRDAHVAERPALRRSVRGVPAALAHVIERATHLSAAERFESADALLSALEAVRSAPTPRLLFAGAVAAVLAIAALVWLALATSNRGATPRDRLAFAPRDLVLITRFENKTGEPVFDGAIEYALERELLDSRLVGLAPVQRVHDALTTMRRPIDTVVTREVGREVALRDGQIKALLGGSIEKVDGRYVLRADLLAPDGTSVATHREEAATAQDVRGALVRQARRVREQLGEQLPRLPAGTAQNQQGTTASLKAYQLYNRAYQLGLQQQWEASLVLAREAVREDPQFASGWTWVAWALNNSKGDPREVRAAAERARTLKEGAPEWERLWIESSYHSVTRDWATSIPPLRALLDLRPDHYYAANNLQLALLILGRRGEASDLFERIAELRPLDARAQHNAAANVVAATRDTTRARPYVDRVRALLASGSVGVDKEQLGMWVEMFDAYTAWKQRDVRTALQRVDAAVARYQESFNSSHTGFQAGHFYLSLGQIERAEETMAIWRSDVADVQRLFLPAVRNDRAGWQRELRRLEKVPAGTQLRARPMHYLSAGLTADARRLVDAFDPDRNNPVQAALVAVGEGHLALLDGRLAAAEQIFMGALTELRSNSSVQEYHHACRGLATVFGRLNRPIDALKQLEECERNEPYLIESGFFGTHQWMLTRLQLADLYRERGRIEDARRIETDLRALLAVADPDHPLLVALAGRRDVSPSPAAADANRLLWSGRDVPWLMSISADGRRLAYWHDATGNIVLRDLVTGADRIVIGRPRATPDETVDNFSLSPDGGEIAYAWWTTRNGRAFLELRVARLDEEGVSARTIYGQPDWMGVEGWSHDGRILLTRRRADRTTEIALVAPDDGTFEVMHAVASLRVNTAALSPDGRVLAFDAPADAQLPHNDVFVRTGDRVAAVVESPAHKTVVGWTRDGSSVVFMSDAAGQTSHLMAQRIVAGRADGPPIVLRRNIDGDVAGLTAAGDVLLRVETNDQLIYTVPVDLTTGKTLGKPSTPVPSLWSRTRYPKWSADGRHLATVSQARGPGTGQRMLAIHGPGGTRSLTLQLGQFWTYDWSPDGGSFLARAGNFEGRQGIYRIDAISGAVTPVLLNEPDRGHFMPQWSRAGTSFFYVRGAQANLGGSLVERSLATGSERVVYEVSDLQTADGRPFRGMRDHVVSPSHRYVAGMSVVDKHTALWVVSLDDRRVRELLRAPRPNAFSTNALVWTPDGRHVIVNVQVGPGARELWAVDIADGTRVRLDIGVPNLRDGAIAVHPDGHRVTFLAGEQPTFEVRLVGALGVPQRSSR